MERSANRELETEAVGTVEQETTEKMPLVSPLEYIRQMFSAAWQRERAARLPRTLPNWQEWITEKHWTLANSSKDPSLFVSNIPVEPVVKKETETDGNDFSLAQDAIAATSDVLRAHDKFLSNLVNPLHLKMPAGSNQAMGVAEAKKFFGENINKQGGKLSIEDITNDLSAIAHKGFHTTGVLPVAVKVDAGNEVIPGKYFLGFRVPVDESEIEFVGEPQKFDFTEAPMVKKYLEEQHGLEEHLFPLELSTPLETQAQALSQRLKTPFDLPKVELSPELLAHWPKIKEVLDELFGTGNLEAILSPRADQLTDAYFEAMYPPTKTDEDKKNGLISFRPDWWNKQADTKDANNQLLFPGETFGQVYIRAMRAQAKSLEGKIILGEPIQKPKYIDGKQKYGTVEGTDDSRDKLLANLRTLLDNTTMVRPNHTYTKLRDTIITKLKEHTDKQLEKRGVPRSVFPHLNFLLLPNHLFNLQTTLLHPLNSTTNCSEWSSTVLEKKDGTPTNLALLSGHSDYGGASCASDRVFADALGYWGFRLSVVLS